MTPSTHAGLPAEFAELTAWDDDPGSLARTEQFMHLVGAVWAHLRDDPAWDRVIDRGDLLGRFAVRGDAASYTWTALNSREPGDRGRALRADARAALNVVWKRAPAPGPRAGTVELTAGTTGDAATLELSVPVNPKPHVQLGCVRPVR